MLKRNVCDRCVTDRTNCLNCMDNPIYANVPLVSLFQEYIPVCPRGYKDCVSDPAYILYHYPSWYKELYGSLAPSQVILLEGGCMERYREDPEEDFYCYDDGD